MDVRCDRCSTTYDFDEARIPAEGLAVKCSSCGHVFRAFRRTAPATAAEWLVRPPGGSPVRCPDLATLQRWVVERRLTRLAEYSTDGQSWQRLGDLAELQAFFQLVEAAALAPTAVAPAPIMPAPAAAPIAAPPPPAGGMPVRRMTPPLPAYTGAVPMAGPPPAVAVSSSAVGGPPPPRRLTPPLPAASAQNAAMMPTLPPDARLGPQAAGQLGAVPGGAQWEGSQQALPNMPTTQWQLGALKRDGGPTPAQARAPQPIDDAELPRSGVGKWIALAVVLALLAAGVAMWVVRPPFVDRLLGHPISPVLAQRFTEASAELRKDSYASLERARGLFEAIVTADPRFAAARAGAAEADLTRAAYLDEEAVELSVRVAAAPAAEQPALQKQLEERRKELQVRADRAFAQAKVALELDPDGVDGLRAMADYYRLMKATDSARPLLERARERAPVDPWVALVMGLSAAADPTLADSAQKSLEQALAAAPDLERARYVEARVLAARGDKAKAEELARAVLRSVPDHERALALTQALAPPPPPPEPAAEPAAETTPVTPTAHELTYDQLLAKAEKLRQSEKPKQAIELYEKAIEENAEDPDAFTGLGLCYLDLEQFDAAIANFSRALTLVPRFSDAHFGIAEAFRAKGQKKDAIKHYKAYLDIVPEGEDAESAKKALSELQP
jgi:predicted Zn finger-like uncharacterized protein